MVHVTINRYPCAQGMCSFHFFYIYSTVQPALFADKQTRSGKQKKVHVFKMLKQIIELLRQFCFQGIWFQKKCLRLLPRSLRDTRTFKTTASIWLLQVVWLWNFSYPNKENVSPVLDRVILAATNYIPSVLFNQKPRVLTCLGVLRWHKSTSAAYPAPSAS